jgi:hypothetical protein
MVLSADQRIEELGAGKAYASDFATVFETIESSADEQASDAKQFHPPSPGQPDHPNTPFKTDNNHPESAEGFFFDKIEVIRQAIVETISEMKSRGKLNQLFILGIDSKITNLLHDLEELKHWSLGNNPSIESRRIHLEKEILQLEKEKRINNLHCWRDLLLLKKDLREALQEYKSLMRFREILS